MRILILLALFITCSAVRAAQTKGVAYNPTTFVVIQTNLTQTFETNNVTDELNVGVAGEQGVITLNSTNGTYAVTLSLDSSGTLFIKYGTSNMLTLLVGTNSGHTGAGTKYLADGGAFVTPSSPVGNVTNININPTDGTYPVRSNAVTFKDGTLLQWGTNVAQSGRFFQFNPLLIGQNASNYTGVLFPSSSWPGTFVVSSFADDGFGRGKLVVSSSDSTSFNGGAFLDVTATTTASATNLLEAFTSSRSGGSISYSFERKVDPYTQANNYLQFKSNSVALMTLDGFGQIVFGPGTTNVVYRSGSDLFYTNGLVGAFAFHVQGPNGTANIGVTPSGHAQMQASASKQLRLSVSGGETLVFQTTIFAPETDNAISLGNGPNRWLDLYLSRNVVWNGSTNTVTDSAGVGSPEGVLVRDIGSTYRRLDGGATTAFYLKTSGSGNTGWSAVSGTSGAQTRTLNLFRFPDSVDGAGCTYVNTNDFTARTFMRPRFDAAGATNANFATFSCLVPSDLNTAVDLTASIKVALVAGDTAASTYTLGMASVANSASSSPTAANYVTLTVPADGSGAAGDVEGVSGVTLTGWRSAMTAGQWLYIQLQRDGTDASATAEDLLALEITYTSTQ